MSENRIEELAHKYRQGTLTEAEQAEFDGWYASHQDEELHHSQADQPEALKQRLYLPLQKAMRQPVRLRRLKRIAFAASVLLVVGLSVGIYYGKKEITYKNEIVPGHEGATLTLSNGKQIKLEGTSNGELAKEAGVSITKTANGQLVYEINERGEAANAVNTLSTTNGETYQVRLPDGSAVWLNATSSLTYAANFSGQEKREVKLAGEAYFEVAKDPHHPFIIRTNNEEVEVLGTHFNVNSYADEPAPKTTLLEGAIRVTAGNSFKILQPGEQVTLKDNKLFVSEANTEEAVAWKNGYFRFNQEKISSIMRKLSRWYDIEVEYDGPVPDDELSGTLSRSTNINKVLNALEYYNTVHFKIEGKKVIVTKQVP